MLAPRTATANMLVRLFVSDGVQRLTLIDVSYERPGQVQAASDRRCALDGTMLHQYPQIPGTGGFLPESLPRKTAQRSLDAISPGHRNEQEQFNGFWWRMMRPQRDMTIHRPALVQIE